METLPAVEIPPFLTKEYRLKLIEQHYEAEYLKMIKLYYSAAMNSQRTDIKALGIFQKNLEHLDKITNDLKGAC